MNLHYDSGEQYSSSNIGTMETILPAVLGLTAAGLLSGLACLCARQLRGRNRKQTPHDAAAYPFQPTRRPTAVRSPSGQPPHYLKKSPSPTGANQTLGLLQPLTEPTALMSASASASASASVSASAAASASAPASASASVIKYMETDEIPSKTKIKMMGGEDLRSPEVGANNKDETTSPVNKMHPGGGGVVVADQYGKLGTIYFKLRHLAERNALMVSIIRCRGLPSKAAADGLNGRTPGATDPYIKLQLLPDKQHKVKTRVVRNTRNPVYDEDFTFYGLNMLDLQKMSLHFIILSFDRYSRDDVIGEVICPLNSIEVGDIAKEALSISKEIQPRSLKMRSQGRGELLISLCWQPAAGRLTVVLLKARNLPRMDMTGFADPYVKIYLLFNGQRIAKKKTHVKKRTLSPVFNESFAFDIPAAEGNGATLEGVSLELMVLDWDRVTKNEVIGRLELGGAHSSGTALNHWHEVCNSPRRQIAEWHKLVE